MNLAAERALIRIDGVSRTRICEYSGTINVSKSKKNNKDVDPCN